MEQINTMTTNSENCFLFKYHHAFVMACVKEQNFVNIFKKVPSVEFKKLQVVALTYFHIKLNGRKICHRFKNVFKNFCSSHSELLYGKIILKLKERGNPLQWDA